MPGMDKTMKEFAAGELHSGSKTGPVVRNRAQAIAIGLSGTRKKRKKRTKAPVSPIRRAMGAA